MSPKFLQRVVENDGFGWGGSPVAVSVTAYVKKPLNEDTVALDSHVTLEETISAS